MTVCDGAVACLAQERLGKAGFCAVSIFMVVDRDTVGGKPV